MGDVVEFKRVVVAEVRRFGRAFKAKMHTGPSPQESDPQVAIYVDGVLVTWATAEFLTLQWSGLTLDLGDDQAFIEPGMLGMANVAENDADVNFLMDAEDYVLSLLRDELVRQMVAQYGPEEDTPLNQLLAKTLTPRERALRAIGLWHNHGRVEDHLPLLMAIEIANAAEEMGEAVAVSLEEELEAQNEPTDVVEMVRGLIEDTLSRWQKEDELHVQ